MRRPGSEEYAAGENSRNESQACCQVPPGVLGVEDDEVKAETAHVVAGGKPGLAAADHHHLRPAAHSVERPGMKMRATSASPTTAPTSCTAMNPATDPGAIPAKVSVKARMMVTAGLAKDVDEVNQ